MSALPAQCNPANLKHFFRKLIESNGGEPRIVFASRRLQVTPLVGFAFGRASGKHPVGVRNGFFAGRRTTDTDTDGYVFYG
ncbi:hypothetical protein [Paraburkholderia aromaticivorans]|uniref:hypothetical protein n=1 Tax=Paraburkholderia aromaticivorans TaxID=2026199 RepID=UPI0012FDF1A6|nr:hypothetical protein [Paraburkholderia aromaticivorans]